ncbi:efflux RND transporter permease subunit [Sphingobium nicotianae]|uniref:Efflux RND transporter permease subunit n=1 Tax=Sphingobium nicotianae TaxID=2782607 RepID=A0A9X1DCH9_9SPHN|nr:efflux RND transporter permease subunit [Sphingobium nicotianae]MBT2187600.1 efflux RND transporter permease subunit [Sphingobium nicotianae]
MMISDLSVRRPVVATVMALLLTIIGLVGFFSLSVREYPDTDPPVVSVETRYTGANAAVIESRITQPLEQRLAGIAGIESISSSSRDGGSYINIEFRAGRDVDSAANDVRDRVAAGAADRPIDALPPEVRKVDGDAQPIIFFAIMAPGWDKTKLGDFVTRVVIDRLSTIDGVAQIQSMGLAKPSMRVWLDADRLAALRLTPRDVENALRRQNVELPAGRIEARSQNLSLRVQRGFTTPDDFKSLVIGRGADGYQVRLGDIARIEEGPENPYSMFRYNGQTGVGLGIVRQSGANTLAVAEEAKKVMAEMARTFPPGVRVELGNDSTLFIDQAIKGVWETLIEAALLVTIVVFLFLGSVRATIVPMITVPICLLTTFAVLWIAGYSINLLTLLALVLAIGLVVDDAIVVLENVYHRIEQGEEPLYAAFAGTRQVGFAVMATTLVVCAVFVPVMFLSGQTGLLFRELAVAMIAALSVSGLLALTLTPMMCSKFLRHAERGWLTTRVDRLMNRTETGYRYALDKVLRRPLPVIIAVALLLGSASIMFRHIDAELAPAEDAGTAQIRFNAPEGVSFKQADDYARQVEAVVQPMVGKGAVRGMNARIPNNGGESEDFNSGQIAIFLRHWDERKETTQDIARIINRKLADLPTVRGNAVVNNRMSRSGQPLSFVIAGNSYQDLARARDRILDAARDNPGILNLDADYVENKPQLVIEVDRQRAGDLGISVDDVSQALQTMMGSRRVSTYVRDGEEYYVVLQAEAFNRDDEAGLAKVYVRSASGALVPLSNLVTARQAATARELGRFNKMRSITLNGGLAPGYSLSKALAFLEQEAAQSPEVLAVGYKGESQQFKQTGSSIWFAFGLTVIVIYLLLAAQFESFVHPAVIISAVPMGVAGGIIGLFLTGTTINLFSQIGIIMLVGLAVKNGILIVEYANQLRDAGKDIKEAIREAAARRLRPILMTSIATVAGAVPLALSHGAGAAARSSIGWVIVFGVSIATAITLFVVPILYRRLARGTQSPQFVARKLRDLVAARGGREGGGLAQPAE